MIGERFEKKTTINNFDVKLQQRSAKINFFET